MPCRGAGVAGNRLATRPVAGGCACLASVADQRRGGTVQPGLPTGLAGHLGREGAHEVNGVRYYSWSGTLQPGLTDRGRNRFDGSNRFCRLFARSFVREKGQCDGMVGRFSSRGAGDR